MPPKTPKITVFAPAKVNLHLKIINRRPDGYHDLESLFLAVNFGDTLHFEPLERENALDLAVEGVSFNLPAEKNLIFRALSLFRERTGFSQGLRIKAEKRIPLGGGLGGGSSDAAATLLALNRLAAPPLSRASLLEMADALGSDVPFFIYETAAAWVTGRGENIKPLEIPLLFLVLVNPGFSSDTATAFRLLDESRVRCASTWMAQREDKMNFSVSSCSLCLREKNFGSFFNDFLPVFPEPEKSVYREIICQLQNQGADYAGLSGSGSTCFGVFLEKTAAEQAAASLRGKWNFVKYCSSLSQTR